VTVNNVILAEIIHDYKLKRNTHKKFVVRFLDYVGDEEASDCPEFWQFPFETLQSGIGDCEDGAILMASLMIQAGIPAYRVKVCAGYVQESPTAPQGGHCYCYKPLAKNGGYNGCYQELWFTFNNEYSWNQDSLEVDARRISRNRSTPLKETFPVTTSLKSVMTKIKDKIKD